MESKGWYRVRKIQPLDPTLSQLNSTHNLTCGFINPTYTQICHVVPTLMG
jgi:hypothetical protein